MANVRIPVPASTAALLLDPSHQPRKDIHPGLLIGKLAPWHPFLEQRQWHDALPERASSRGIERPALFGHVADGMVCPERKRLHQSWSKRWNATASELGATVRKFCGETEVVLWLASPSAADLGFCLHHTYGLPYLPASGLKGLARAYSEYRAAESPERATTIRDIAARVFGPLLGEDQGDATRAGSVVFLDGIIDPSRVPDSLLELDVMTPHHSSYYTGDGEWPHDCESPKPLPFLRMRRGLKFELAIAPRDPGAAGAAEDVEWAWEMLEGGLRVLGLGAKTSAGYGVLVREGSRPAVAAASVVSPPVRGSAPQKAGQRATGSILRLNRNEGWFTLEGNGKRYRVNISDVVGMKSKVTITDIQRWANQKTVLTFDVFDDGTARNVAPKEG